MLNKDEILNLQKSLQNFVEVDLAAQQGKVPSDTINGRALIEASSFIQQAIFKLGKVVENLDLFIN